jgi:hypothetical protein
VRAAAQQAAQAGAGAGATADAGAQPAGGAQNDNVVDAEFEEVKDKDRKA